MEVVEHKVPGGKLIRMEFELRNGIIRRIKITGDFFIYPEDAIIEIENFLKGLSVNIALPKLEQFLCERNIKLIGFSAADIARMLAS